MPGPQSTNENTALTFTIANDNHILTSDVDASTNPVKVTLSVVPNGALTLSQTTGLTFLTGDGTNDPNMTFTGTISNINAALNGMSFTPNTGFSGVATLTVITDDQGNTGTGGAKTDTDPVIITVNNTINDAPTANAGGPYTVNEGGSVQLNGSGNDPDGTISSYAWDLDNNGSFETSGQNPNFSAASIDGPASRTVVLRVTDNQGATATSNATVTINNAPPTGTFPATRSVAEGSSSTFAFTSPSDPSSADTSVGLHYAYSCTGASLASATYDAGSGTSTSVSCPASAFDDGPGNQTVRARIIDKDGGSTEYTTAVTITNVAPTAANFNAPASVNEGSNINLSLTSPNDPSTADTTAGFTYAFDCGSGTYGSFGPSSTATCSTNDSGSRTVRAKIKDKDGDARQQRSGGRGQPGNGLLHGPVGSFERRHQRGLPLRIPLRRYGLPE